MDLTEYLNVLERIKHSFQPSEQDASCLPVCAQIYQAFLHYVVANLKQLAIETALSSLVGTLRVYAELRARLAHTDVTWDQLGHVIFIETARVVLGLDFQRLEDADPGSVKATFKQTLNETCTILKQYATGEYFLVLTWLVLHGWSQPILQSLMKGEDVEEENALTYLRSGEYQELFRLRVDMLMDNGCDDFALNLATWCTRSPVFKTDPYIRQAQLLLLIKLNRQEEFHTTCMQIWQEKCCLSKAILQSILTKAREDEKRPLLTLTQTFLVHDWMKSDEYCCTEALLQLWLSLQREQEPNADDFIQSVSKMDQLARSPRQLQILVKSLKTQFGKEFIQFSMECSLKAVRMDRHNLDTARIYMKDDGEADKAADSLAKTCLIIAILFEGHRHMQLAAKMTAFYMDPSEEMYHEIKDMVKKNPPPVVEEGQPLPPHPVPPDIDTNTYFELLESVDTLRAKSYSTNASWAELQKPLRATMEEAGYLYNYRKDTFVAFQEKLPKGLRMKIEKMRKKSQDDAAARGSSAMPGSSHFIPTPKQDPVDQPGSSEYSAPSQPGSAEIKDDTKKQVGSAEIQIEMDKLALQNDNPKNAQIPTNDLQSPMTGPTPPPQVDIKLESTPSESHQGTPMLSEDAQEMPLLDITLDEIQQVLDNSSQNKERTIPQGVSNVKDPTVTMPETVANPEGSSEELVLNSIKEFLKEGDVNIPTTPTPDASNDGTAPNAFISVPSHNLESTEGEDDSNIFRCKFCGKAYDSMRQRRRHQEWLCRSKINSAAGEKDIAKEKLKDGEVCKDTNGLFICGLCKATLSSLKSLRRHERRTHNLHIKGGKVLMPTGVALKDCTVKLDRLEDAPAAKSSKPPGSSVPRSRGREGISKLLSKKYSSNFFKGNMSHEQKSKYPHSGATVKNKNKLSIKNEDFLRLTSEEDSSENDVDYELVSTFEFDSETGDAQVQLFLPEDKSQPVLCDFCGTVCLNYQDMRNHQATCKMTPKKSPRKSPKSSKVGSPQIKSAIAALFKDDPKSDVQSSRMQASLVPAVPSADSFRNLLHAIPHDPFNMPGPFEHERQLDSEKILVHAEVHAPPRHVQMSKTMSPSVNVPRALPTAQTQSQNKKSTSAPTKVSPNFANVQRSGQAMQQTFSQAVPKATYATAASPKPKPKPQPRKKSQEMSKKVQPPMEHRPAKAPSQKSPSISSKKLVPLSYRICLTCGVEFQNASTCFKHQADMSHFNKGVGLMSKFKCAICSLVFNNSQEGEVHLKGHEPAKSKTKSPPNDQSNSRLGQKSLKATSGSSPNKKSKSPSKSKSPNVVPAKGTEIFNSLLVYCPYCQKGFLSQNSLQQHLLVGCEAQTLTLGVHQLAKPAASRVAASTPASSARRPDPTVASSGFGATSPVSAVQATNAHDYTTVVTSLPVTGTSVQMHIAGNDVYVQEPMLANNIYLGEPSSIANPMFTYNSGVPSSASSVHAPRIRHEAAVQVNIDEVPLTGAADLPLETSFEDDQDVGDGNEFVIAGDVEVEKMTYKNVLMLRHKVWLCSNCCMEFALKKDVLQHWETTTCKTKFSAEATDIFNFQCIYCGEMFADAKDCRDHQFISCLRDAGMKIQQLKNKHFHCKKEGCKGRYYEKCHVERHLIYFHKVEKAKATAMVQEWFPASFLTSMHNLLSAKKEAKSRSRSPEKRDADKSPRREPEKLVILAPTILAPIKEDVVDKPDDGTPKKKKKKKKKKKQSNEESPITANANQAAIEPPPAANVVQVVASTQLTHPRDPISLPQQAPIAHHMYEHKPLTVSVRSINVPSPIASTSHSTTFVPTDIQVPFPVSAPSASRQPPQGSHSPLDDMLDLLTEGTSNSPIPTCNISWSPMSTSLQDMSPASTPKKRSSRPSTPRHNSTTERSSSVESQRSQKSPRQKRPNGKYLIAPAEHHPCPWCGKVIEDKVALNIHMEYTCEVSPTKGPKTKRLASKRSEMSPGSTFSLSQDSRDSRSIVSDDGSRSTVHRVSPPNIPILQNLTPQLCGSIMSDDGRRSSGRINTPNNFMNSNSQAPANQWPQDCQSVNDDGPKASVSRENTPNSLTESIIAHAAGTSDLPKCNFCGIIFANSIELERHVLMMHPQVINFVRCHTCNTLCDGMRGLNAHFCVEPPPQKDCEEILPEDLTMASRQCATMLHEEPTKSNESSTHLPVMVAPQNVETHIAGSLRSDIGLPIVPSSYLQKTDTGDSFGVNDSTETLEKTIMNALDDMSPTIGKSFQEGLLEEPKVEFPLDCSAEELEAPEGDTHRNEMPTCSIKSETDGSDHVDNGDRMSREDNMDEGDHGNFGDYLDSGNHMDSQYEVTSYNVSEPDSSCAVDGILLPDAKQPEAGALTVQPTEAEAEQPAQILDEINAQPPPHQQSPEHSPVGPDPDAPRQDTEILNDIIDDITRAIPKSTASPDACDSRPPTPTSVSSVEGSCDPANDAASSPLPSLENVSDDEAGAMDSAGQSSSEPCLTTNIAEPSVPITTGDLQELRCDVAADLQASQIVTNEEMMDPPAPDDGAADGGVQDDNADLVETEAEPQEAGQNSTPSEDEHASPEKGEEDKNVHIDEAQVPDVDTVPQPGPEHEKPIADDTRASDTEEESQTEPHEKDCSSGSPSRSSESDDEGTHPRNSMVDVSRPDESATTPDYDCETSPSSSVATSLEYEPAACQSGHDSDTDDTHEHPAENGPDDEESPDVKLECASNDNDEECSALAAVIDNNSVHSVKTDVDNSRRSLRSSSRTTTPKPPELEDCLGQQRPDHSAEAENHIEEIVASTHSNATSEVSVEKTSDVTEPLQAKSRDNGNKVSMDTKAVNRINMPMLPKGSVLHIKTAQQTSQNPTRAKTRYASSNQHTISIRSTSVDFQSKVAKALKAWSKPRLNHPVKIQQQTSPKKAREIANKSSRPDALIHKKAKITSNAGYLDKMKKVYMQKDPKLRTPTVVRKPEGRQSATVLQPEKAYKSVKQEPLSDPGKPVEPIVIKPIVIKPIGAVPGPTYSKPVLQPQTPFSVKWKTYGQQPRQGTICIPVTKPPDTPSLETTTRTQDEFIECHKKLQKLVQETDPDDFGSDSIDNEKSPVDSHETDNTICSDVLSAIEDDHQTDTLIDFPSALCDNSLESTNSGLTNESSGRYACPFCDEERSFLKEASLVSHLKADHGLNKEEFSDGKMDDLNCPICKDHPNFTDELLLHFHMRAVHSIANYKAGVKTEDHAGSQGYDTGSGSAKTRKANVAKRGHSDSECSESVSSVSENSIVNDVESGINLENGFGQEHPILTSKVLDPRRTCAVCNIAFLKTKHFRMHMSRFHKVQKQNHSPAASLKFKWKCAVCTNVYAKLEDWKLHIATHSKKARLTPEDCSLLRLTVSSQNTSTTRPARIPAFEKSVKLDQTVTSTVSEKKTKPQVFREATSNIKASITYSKKDKLCKAPQSTSVIVISKAATRPAVAHGNQSIRSTPVSLQDKIETSHSGSSPIVPTAIQQISETPARCNSPVDSVANQITQQGGLRKTTKQQTSGLSEGPAGIKQEPASVCQQAQEEHCSSRRTVKKRRCSCECSNVVTCKKEVKCSTETMPPTKEHPTKKAAQTAPHNIAVRRSEATKDKVSSSKTGMPGKWCVWEHYLRSTLKKQTGASVKRQVPPRARVPPKVTTAQPVPDTQPVTRSIAKRTSVSPIPRTSTCIAELPSAPMNNSTTQEDCQEIHRQVNDERKFNDAEQNIPGSRSGARRRSTSMSSSTTGQSRRPSTESLNSNSTSGNRQSTSSGSRAGSPTASKRRKYSDIHAGEGVATRGTRSAVNKAAKTEVSTPIQTRRSVTLTADNTSSDKHSSRTKTSMNVRKR